MTQVADFTHCMGRVIKFGKNFLMFLIHIPLFNRMYLYTLFLQVFVHTSFWGWQIQLCCAWSDVGNFGAENPRWLPKQADLSCIWKMWCIGLWYMYYSKLYGMTKLFACTYKSLNMWDMWKKIKIHKYTISFNVKNFIERNKIICITLNEKFNKS